MNNFFKKYFKQNRRGTALLIVMLFLSALLSAVLISSSIAMEGVKLRRLHKYSIAAYFTAESGIERTLWEHRKNNFPFKERVGGCCTPGTCSISYGEDCSYSAGNSVQFASAGAYCCVSSYETTLGLGSYIVKFKSDEGDGKVNFSSRGSYMGTYRTVEVFNYPK